LRFAVFPAAFGRLLLLWTSLVVIVGAAYLIRQKVSDETVEAMRWVSHTHEVRATLFELTSSLNEMQAAALASRLNGALGATSARYTDAHTRYGSLVDALRDLTRDSAEQQERVGMLRARIEDRVAVFDHAMHEQTDFVLAAAELDSAAARFAVDDITKAILDREETLVKVRQENADRQVRESHWVTLATTLAQILLLGAVIWASERQSQRRVVAESEARRAVGRARLIVETVREPIAVIASDLTILQANRAFADFYGATRPIQGVLSEVRGWVGDAALHQRLRDVSLTKRELWDYETVQRTVKDVERNVLVNARPMVLPDTVDTVALLTVSDLTAHKRSEAQILELNRQLAGKVAQVTEVNRELEAFSYSVSHDLRAPLRHIAGFAEKLRSALVDTRDEKVTHYCEVIAESARRMSTLIEDLLSYSRLGKHALRLQPVDMQSLVEEVRALLMSSVEGRAITWRLAPLPVVIADASMLQLAWQNLLDNAIKYTAGKENAVIEIGSEDVGEERVFWVRDNGAGFDMRYVDKLFGVFQRLHKASTFSGTGIGLASVRRIIARHGGRTWAEGALDQGSTFFFSLPRLGTPSLRTSA
jgi:signal transduction histidine kinase